MFLIEFKSTSMILLSYCDTELHSFEVNSIGVRAHESECNYVEFTQWKFSLLFSSRFLKSKEKKKKNGREIWRIGWCNTCRIFSSFCTIFSFTPGIYSDLSVRRSVIPSPPRIRRLRSYQSSLCHAASNLAKV